MKNSSDNLSDLRRLLVGIAILTAFALGLVLGSAVEQGIRRPAAAVAEVRR